jgi:hypothetical protein
MILGYIITHVEENDMNKRRLPLLARIAILQFVFLIFHYLYDWFPGSVSAVISGINESIYQHMKIGFFSALMFVLIEIVITGLKTASTAKFIYSRIFLCVFFPLAMVVIYLVSPLLFGRIESVWGEIIFANVALVLTSLSSITIARQIEKSEPDLSFRVIIIALFFVSLLQFIVFTKRPPWFDIFTVPPGWE